MRGFARRLAHWQHQCAASPEPSGRSYSGGGRFVIEGLLRHRDSQDERQALLDEAWRDLGLVIDRGNGEPMSPHTLSQKFRAASKSAGLDLNFHGLRHAHASLMLAGGVHLKVVSERLGHSTIGITADLYSHVSPNTEREAAATLGELLHSR